MITPGFVGAQVLLDLLVSLVLLQLSGGADHPFTALLLVPIVLATALSPRWAAVAVGVAVLGFGALMVANSIAHGGSERPGLLHGSCERFSRVCPGVATDFADGRGFGRGRGLRRGRWHAQ